MYVFYMLLRAYLKIFTHSDNIQVMFTDHGLNFVFYLHELILYGKLSDLKLLA